MLPVDLEEHTVPSTRKRLVKGVGLVEEALFDDVHSDLEVLERESPAGSGEQAFARRTLLALEGDQGRGPLRDLSRINDAMLRLKPGSSKYKDLEWEQRRAVEAINSGEPSLVDQVIYFFEDVF
ncbi:hypothetical protein HY087_00090 [Candidatus Gottesmanbacteria bacterium]|nr:hypothetical protein [Candidatus Gottesmanbacteria bacterium]